MAGQCTAALEERNLGRIETNTQLGAEKASPAAHCAHPRLFILFISRRQDGAGVRKARRVENPAKNGSKQQPRRETKPSIL